MKIVEELRNSSFSSDLIAEVEEMEDWPFVIYFLPLLMRLERLSVIPRVSNQAHFNQAFTRLLQSTSISPSLGSVFLEALGSQGILLSVDVILSFCFIPSMTYIYGRSVGSSAEPVDHMALLFPEPGSMVNAFQASNVQTLKLFECILSDEDLYMLLSLPKGLKEFAYIERDDYEAFRSPERLQDAISHSSNTLDTLILDLRSSSLEPNQFCTFSNFSSLQVLAIPYELLVDGGPRQITDRLPPYLKTLTLRAIDRDGDTAQRIVECFNIILENLSDTILPDLNQIARPHLDEWLDLSSLNDLAAVQEVEIGRFYDGWGISNSWCASYSN